MHPASLTKFERPSPDRTAPMTLTIYYDRGGLFPQHFRRFRSPPLQPFLSLPFPVYVHLDIVRGTRQVNVVAGVASTLNLAQGHSHRVSLLLKSIA